MDIVMQRIFFGFFFLFFLHRVESDILVYSDDPPAEIMEKFRDMPSRFGEIIDSDGIKGYIVPATPNDGCTKIQAPPNTTFTNRWIVIIARFNCSFEDKIRNAQAAGFKGAIVHNVNSNDLQIMFAKNPEGIKIPSVFIGEDAGMLIKLNYLYNYGYYVIINGELPYDLNHLLIPFAIVVSLSVIVLSIFMVLQVVKCVRDRRRARRHRLSSSSLKKIPTCKFTKGDPYDTCAICLDDYIEGDKLRVLPCAHAYHYKCIDPWLTKNRRVCPVCKRKVFVSKERVTSRSVQNRESHSDTDSDESVHAPLISSTAQTVTEGGTFQGTRRNIFSRDWNDMMRTVRDSTNSREAGPITEADLQENADTRPDSATRSSTAVRGRPFLTGFLNLNRKKLIPSNNRNNSDDSESLLPSTNSQRIIEIIENDATSDDSSSFHSSLHTIPEDREAAENEHSMDSSGRIGVVALPNSENNDHAVSGHSSRDYIV